MDEDLAGQDAQAEPLEQRHAVLEVFGLRLEVSNPRLAELLTMDAKDALTSDMRDLGSPREMRDLREVAAQALPDVVVAPPTVREQQQAVDRQQFRARVGAIGRSLGFDAVADGMWHSPTGVSIVTRSIDSDMSLAAASHYVGQLAEHREEAAGVDAAVLFVVDGQQSADVFRVAIRQRRLYDAMRVISLENLETVNRMCQSGAIDHAKAVILLAPAANIDVGEILSVIRAAGHSDGASF